MKITNLIIAGGSLNIPERGGVAPGVVEETPAGVLPPLGGAATGADIMSNLSKALKAALTEAGQTVAKQRMTAMSGLVEGGAAPSVINAAIGLAQSGLRQTREDVFGDVMATYKEQTQARQKEIDRINDLRAEYGTLVPSNVTDLDTALNLIAPLVDKERKLKLEKTAKDQQDDEDVESAAEFVAKGGSLAQVGGSSDYKAKVRIRAEAIKSRLETEAKQEYKDRIAFRLEKKQSDFETERTLAIQDDNLTVVEQREIIDYIDTLEQSVKAAKKSGGKGFFNFLSSAPEETLPLTLSERTGQELKRLKSREEQLKSIP